MRSFCPVCGRTKSFNPEVIGLTPKVCPVCLHELRAPRKKTPPAKAAAPTLHPLRLFGLTLVRN